MVIITKATKGTKVKAGITEDSDKVVATTGTITNIRAKVTVVMAITINTRARVMGAMATTTNTGIKIMVTKSTMVMAISTVESTIKTEDMAMADTTGLTDPTVITDLMHMDMDHMPITLSHMSHLRLI